MILEKETYEKFGYYPNDLPLNSHKNILVVCDKCGKIRVNHYRNYRALCRSCSMKGKHDGKNNPMFGKHPSIETLRKKSKSLSGKNNPMFGKHHSEQSCCKISESHANIQGINNPNWKGGISFEPYCYKFNNALKEEIRDKFGRKCFLCPKTEEEEERKLSVHHVDYNKEQGCNGVSWLLVPLCMSCNARVNFNRDYWQDLIIENLKQGRYL